jgi:cytochrome c553
MVGNVLAVAILMLFNPKVRVCHTWRVSHLPKLTGKMLMEACTRCPKSIESLVNHKLFFFQDPNFGPTMIAVCASCHDAHTILCKESCYPSITNDAHPILSKERCYPSIQVKERCYPSANGPW